MITIIVIIILAAAVILTLTNNNPINNAKQAAFVNDLDSFKSELDMYKASEYAKRIGDFEQTSLEGDEISLTFAGQTPEEAGSQTMYTAIPSLKGIAKYAGQFAIEKGKLVYRGKDLVKKDWAASVGVEHSVAGEPKVVASVTGDDVIEPGTDVVYTVQVQSTDTITLLDTTSIKSKIKLLTKAGVEVATQPDMIVSAPTGTATAKQFTVTVPTNTLPYGEYKLQILEGIATNTDNVVNQPYTTVHVFEITDNTPPEAPEISAVPATAYTSGNVVVTIDYKDADVKLYSFTGNVGDWQTYTSALNITTNNTTVYAMGKDNAENETGLVTKTIANIDKVAPQNALFNLTSNEETLSGTITLADNESGINLSQSKYIVTTQATALAINATEWNAATVLTANPKSISVTKENGDYYVQTLSTDNVGNKRVNVSGVIKVSNTVAVNAPELVTGMTAKKWNATTSTWDTVSNPGTDTSWYDYKAKQWANAQTADGSMWVWIPRYEYKIPTPHTNVAQEILINFIIGTSTTQTNGYIMHPGFTFGDDELTGIWVAKFEATAREGVGNTEASDNVLTKNVKIIPGVQSWRYISVSNMYDICRKMENDITYGWSSNGIDTHLIKNIEWGAVAYLSNSKYGKNSNITRNSNTNFYTGGGTGISYITNVAQSTTGTIYGIYDMSGGAHDRVAAYLDNGNVSTYGASLVNAANKYKDVYLLGESDAEHLNYLANSSKKGDAVYETTSDHNHGWYNNYVRMPYSSIPFFIRGHVYDYTGAGIFAFGSGEGWPGIGSPNAFEKSSFRPVLAVGTGL